MSNNEWYALRNAVFERRYRDAKSMLNSSSLLKDARNGIGETVLHFLAVENDVDGVKWLFSNGLSLNSKNEFGTPLIFEVAQLGYEGLLLWLVENGASLKDTDGDGNSIDQYLIDYGKETILPLINSLRI